MTFVLCVLAPARYAELLPAGMGMNRHGDTTVENLDGAGGGARD